MSTRTIHDRHGDSWRVRQVLPGQQLDTHGGAGALLPDEMAGGCLAFESASGRRLFHPIPPRWMEYSDDELGALCRLASPVRPGRESTVP